MSDNEIDNKWNKLLYILLSLPFAVIFLILILAKVSKSLIAGIAFALATIVCMNIIGLGYPYNVRKDLNFTNKEILIGLLGVIFLFASIFLINNR